MKRILVIGGGAAGMMAAIAAAGSGASVSLAEKNEKLGKKLFITGKGRCNVTNAGEPETLFANCVSNEKFLYSAFYGFDNRAVMELLEEAGCPLKIERGDRVFPVSDHSSDVIAALAGRLKKLGVEILLQTQVKELWLKENGQAAGVLLEDGGRIAADCVIVATGGLSYPSTGSTGDGYRFALETGHRLVETMPSLVPLETKEEWCRRLMGLSLKNVSVRLEADGRLLFEEFGEMLFTHFGVSGPLILSASSYYVHWLGRNGERQKKKGELPTVRLLIDLKPALSMEQLDRRLLRDFEENRNKQFKNALSGLFPIKLIPVMISLSGIHPDKKVNEITKEERKRFAELIKNLPLTVTGIRDYREAIITKGGVSVKDVNPSTMESKRVSGLYFAGEVLDLDALTGGFNLQIAWSTGHLAGISAAQGGANEL